MQGALCTIFSTTLAASIAFTFAQGLGKAFAQQMINKEVGGDSEKKDNAAQRVNDAAAPAQAAYEREIPRRLKFVIARISKP